MIYLSILFVALMGTLYLFADWNRCKWKERALYFRQAWKVSEDQARLQRNRYEQEISDSTEALRRIAKTLYINFCEDLAPEGNFWEVPAEPEPQYFGDFREAIDFAIKLLQQYVREIEAKVREV